MSDNDNIINLLRDEFKHVNGRLDKHYEMFEKHCEQDTEMFKEFTNEFKTTNNRVSGVEGEMKVAKRVGYIISGAVTAVLGWGGLVK